MLINMNIQYDTETRMLYIDGRTDGSCHIKKVGEAVQDAIISIKRRDELNHIIDSVVNDKKYRVLVGEDGDDFVYADNLTYEEAVEKRNEISLTLQKPGCYAYIAEINNF